MGRGIEMNVQKIKETVQYVTSIYDEPLEIGLILGSGLNILGDAISDPIFIPYEDIPHFPKSTVDGHRGQLVLGTIDDRKVLAMQGRFHYYEGYSLAEVTFPIRMMKALGIHRLIVTNAAGGINRGFSPGDLMVITDHINFTGTNPLIGQNNVALGERFPDMTKAYDEQFIQHALACSKRLNISLQTGVYVGNSGPSYETPAEIKMLEIIGADAVGMSTVPEVIVARHSEMRVLGISCISNMAAGILDEQLSHEQVIETTERVQKDFVRLMKQIVATLP